MKSNLIYNYYLLFAFLALLATTKTNAQKWNEVNETLHDEECVYHKHLPLRTMNQLEFDLFSDHKIMKMHQLNSVYAKFDNRKYANHYKPCLMKKQLGLQSSRRFDRNMLRNSNNVKPLLRNAGFKREIDWRRDMMRIRDQKTCGSCWAFAATSIFSSQLYMNDIGDFGNFSEPPELSTQFLVDCCGDNDGCDGGNMDRALEFLDFEGYILESDYPYKAKTKKCNFESSSLNKVSEKIEIVNYFKSSEEEIMNMLQHGPIVVGIAVGQTLYFYSGGILHNCGLEPNITNLNHAVVITGYGVDKETNIPFWTLRNSWGGDWGESGYFRIIRDNHCRCGICFEPSQVKINSLKKINEDEEDDQDSDDWIDIMQDSEDAKFKEKDHRSYIKSSSLSRTYKRIIDVLRIMFPM